MSRKTILAIDFGTSNSVAYLFKNGTPQIVNDDTTTGLTSFPSLVAYDKGKVYTCNAAKNGRKDGRYEYVVSCVKRLIGLSYDEYLHLPDQTVFGCEVKKGSDEKPCFVVSADGMEKDCIEVASELFNTIKKSAMRMNNHEEIDECYVTVPANYKDHQREAIMKAAQRAGLKVMSVVPEPTAAAMSWCFENKNSIGIGEKMLVFDFGGGTLDISVIEYEGKGKFKVCATDGDARLGGSDVDMEVANLVIGMVRNQENERFNPLRNKKKRTRFLAECEETKIGLSSSSDLDFNLSDYGLEEDYRITQNQLQSIVDKTLKNRFEACLNRILVGPNLYRGVIKYVFLVGGSTRLKAVQNYMHSYFHCIFPSVNPDSCVAEGALAIARSQNDHTYGGSVVEIIPFSYGLLCSDNKVVMLLNKDTRIPCESARLSFNNSEDYVSHIKSRIYQWNGREADNGRTIRPVNECTFIKEYQFENPNPKPKGKQQFDIIFKLAVGGTLEVFCIDHATKKEMNHTTYEALLAKEK